MHTVEIIPSAAALLQSMRGLGYSPEAAIADLVDNSLAAGASRIDVDLAWNDGDPCVSVLDDGCGMTGEALVGAMCFGGEGPSALRGEADLGRFGLGLKTASLSQCRHVAVITRQAGETSALAWDVDEVVRSARWNAVVPEPSGAPRVEDLLARQNGTLVLWRRMDAIGGLSGLDRESFYLRVRNIGAHLGMIFHRFLAGDGRRIELYINGRAIRAWDPFQRSHPATITMQSEPIRHLGSVLTVTPYVLPHRDRFANDAEHEEAGGPGGWNERQGFYVYRGRRLLVPGGWLGLGGTRAWTREESSRLARIAVDLPTSLDAEWRIDVRKSQARPPGTLRPRLTGIASLCRTKAREVFAWRGGRARGQTTLRPEDGLWSAGRTAASGYRINRQHPAFQAVAASLGNRSDLLEALVVLLERSVPVERIWLDVSENEGVSSTPFNPEETPALAAQIAALASAHPSSVPIPDRVDQLLRHLPGATPELRRAVLRELEPAHEH